MADYDARASIENLIRQSLPLVLRLIREDDSPEFGTRMLRELVTFSKRLTVILLHSIGRSSAQEFLKQTIETLFTIIVAASGKRICGRKYFLMHSSHNAVEMSFQAQNNRMWTLFDGCVAISILKFVDASKTSAWTRPMSLSFLLFGGHRHRPRLYQQTR